MNRFYYIKNLTKNVIFALKISYKASKKYFILKLFTLIFTTFIPIIIMYLWRLILNGLQNFDSSSHIVIFALSIYIVLTVLTYFINQFNQYVTNMFSLDMQFYTEEVMISKTSRMDLAYFDNSSIGDKISQTRSNFYIIGQIPWSIFGILSEIVNIVITYIILCSFNIWIALVAVILLIPQTIYNKKYNELKLKTQKEQQCDKRKIDYYNNLFCDNDVQFDLKLYRIGHFFIQQIDAIWKKLFHVNLKQDVKYNANSALMQIFGLSSTILVIIVSIFRVASKTMGIGDLQYYMNIVNLFNNQFIGLMYDINNFTTNDKRLTDLQEFINIKTEEEKSGTLIPSKNPRIEFQNVWFKYPGSEEYILKDCSFVIEPHKKVGLLGVNGAGKSTIIKLMFKFYEVDKGLILVDGRDVHEYDVYKLRQIFSVLFQENVKYCLPMREILALSNFDERFNDEKLQKACDLSGVNNVIKDWENGFDSILGRYYADGGKDLSGGQWQLISLARAYFKDSEYIVLDEPSAALDPIAEDKIFEQLYNLSYGKTAVTISHRLSNTTLADKILVIDDGKIIEQGSHFKLLKQDGKYSELFNLQAKRYM